MKTPLNFFLLFGFIAIVACNNSSKDSQTQNMPESNEFELSLSGNKLFNGFNRHERLSGL